MILRFIVIIFFLCCGDLMMAQQQEIVSDTSTITLRTIPVSTIARYKNDPAFQYEVAKEAPRNWWQRFWSRFWEKIGNMLATEAGARATKIILVTVSVIILVFFLIVFSGMSKGGLFGKKNNDNPLDYAVSEDDIHAINFDTAIEDAINAKNFRFAVRLLYLQTLKKLTDAGIINWQINKTNIGYLNELNGKEYQRGFRELTMQFESNWYGDLPIDDNEFRSVRSQFNKFNQQLS